jgi:DNA-binding MarR family transcriptional regulator
MRREIIISLTAAGGAVVEEVTARRRAEIAAIVARMDPDRRLDLVQALRDFGSAADEPDAGGSAPLGWE